MISIHLYIPLLFWMLSHQPILCTITTLPSIMFLLYHYFVKDLLEWANAYLLAYVCLAQVPFLCIFEKEQTDSGMFTINQMYIFYNGFLSMMHHIYSVSANWKVKSLLVLLYLGSTLLGFYIIYGVVLDIRVLCASLIVF